MDKCRANKIEAVYLINRSDTRFIDGNIVMKRKYGKFTRPIHKLKKNQQE